MKRLGAVVLTLALVTVVLGGAVPAAAHEGNSPDRVEVLVGGPGAARAVQNAGGRVTHEFNNFPVVLAEVPEPALQGLRRAPGVRFVEPNGEMWAIQQTIPWGITRVGSPEAWEVSATGVGVRLAILDTGIDAAHPDLAGNVAEDGINTIDETSHLSDGHGHGTHVAGTAGALDNDIGVAGVAPDVTLVAVKVLADSGGGTWASVAAGIDWSIENDIQVINMSLSGGDSETVRLAVDTAWGEGLLLVAAAGNSGNPAGRGDNVGYPAAYDNVIAVAASDSGDGRASFSSTGPAVELIAPGVSILSTVPGGYGFKSGTSMASPHVAGAAAAAWAVNPDLSNEEIRMILQQTAEDLGLPSVQQGHGLVRADLAVAAVGGTEPPDPPDPPATGNIEGTVKDGEGAAIAGATVVVEGTSLSATTGDNGWYLLEDVATGDYSITASMTGYVSQTRTVTVAEGRNTVDFELDAQPVGGVVSVASIMYSTSGGRFGDKHLHVTGALVDDLGSPVGGASVSIELKLDLSTTWNFSGTTGSNGTVTFSLNNAPTGTYTAVVKAVSAEELTWDEATPTNSFTK